MEINIIVNQSKDGKNGILNTEEKRYLIENHFKEVNSYCVKEKRSGREIVSLSNTSLGDNTLITTVMSKSDYK